MALSSVDPQIGLIWDYELLEWVAPETPAVPQHLLGASPSDGDPMDFGYPEYSDEVRAINESGVQPAVEPAPVPVFGPSGGLVGESGAALAEGMDLHPPSPYNPFEKTSSSYAPTGNTPQAPNPFLEGEPVSLEFDAVMADDDADPARESADRVLGEIIEHHGRRRNRSSRQRGGRAGGRTQDRGARSQAQPNRGRGPLTRARGGGVSKAGSSNNSRGKGRGRRQ